MSTATACAPPDLSTKWRDDLVGFKKEEEGAPSAAPPPARRRGLKRPGHAS